MAKYQKTRRQSALLQGPAPAMDASTARSKLKRFSVVSRVDMSVADEASDGKGAAAADGPMDSDKARNVLRRFSLARPATTAAPTAVQAAEMADRYDEQRKGEVSMSRRKSSSMRLSQVSRQEFEDLEQQLKLTFAIYAEAGRMVPAAFNTFLSDADVFDKQFSRQDAELIFASGGWGRCRSIRLLEVRRTYLSS